MNQRDELIQNILVTIDESYALMLDYDSRTQLYGDILLYQAESFMISHIGSHPKITVTELAKMEKKTKGACSKILRKIINKGLAVQDRNPDNLREYFLTLTSKGEAVFQAQQEISTANTLRSLRNLEQFTDEQLENYLEIQKSFNASFENDRT